MCDTSLVLDSESTRVCVCERERERERERVCVYVCHAIGGWLWIYTCATAHQRCRSPNWFNAVSSMFDMCMRQTQMWMHQISQINASNCTYECVVCALPSWMQCGVLWAWHVNTSNLTCECVKLHIWMRQISHMNASCVRSPHGFIAVSNVPDIWMHQISRLNASNLTYECMNASCVRCPHWFNAVSNVCDIWSYFAGAVETVVLGQLEFQHG